MINVTKPFLPPREELNAYIDGIYKRNWLTNHGPLSCELEINLKKYLDVESILFTSNGTTALQLAIKSLGLSGEVITTPFSYVATTSALMWEGCKPVFADIDANSWNISPACVENMITEKTTAILATHVFGNPCDVDTLAEIAKKHNLKLIYDGAHAFGVKVGGKSVFDYGDISTLSFHATKLFHTAEGGAVITANRSLEYKMTQMKNFGHTSPYSFDEIGVNFKNSEFHAAVGLATLRHIENILQNRKSQSLYYNEILKGLPFKFQQIADDCQYNYSYYPVRFESEAQLLKSVEVLNKAHINPRRYFYPSLSSLPYLKRTDLTPIADALSKTILCLPLFHDLVKEEQDMIGRILKNSMKK